MELIRNIFITFMFMAGAGVLILTIYYLMIIAIPLLIVTVVGFIVYSILEE